MKIAEIYKILDEIAPFEAQESWDNSGLLLGNMDDEFDKIYASIDLDSNLIQKIEKNSLVITHHPLIFKGLKSLNPSVYPSNLIYEIIKKDIKIISELKAPIEAGKKVGTIKYYSSGDLIFESDLIVKDKVYEKGILQRFVRIYEDIFKNIEREVS